MRSDPSKELGIYSSAMEGDHLPGAVVPVTRGAHHSFRRKAPSPRSGCIGTRKPIMPLIAPVRKVIADTCVKGRAIFSANYVPCY